MNDLIIKCPSFKNNEFVPSRHTGFDNDISPEFDLLNLDEKTVSLVIIMDDLDVPFSDKYNHWVIWNIPKMNVIPENIEYGPIVKKLDNAVQGIGYGKNRYRGPKQPFFVRNIHRYEFKIYALDCFLELDSKSHKKELEKAMEGHIIQYGFIIGRHKHP